MEKLVKLLNEYELEREKGIEEFKNWALPLWEWSIVDGDLVYDGVELSMNLESAYWDTANWIAISKSYGFIKWLVANDKIDLWKLIMIKDEEQKAIVDIDNSRENTLLMLLAISDTIVDDLISYLK